MLGWDSGQVPEAAALGCQGRAGVQPVQPQLAGTGRGQFNKQFNKQFASSSQAVRKVRMVKQPRRRVRVRR
jgi:hypothetical protein